MNHLKWMNERFDSAFVGDDLFMNGIIDGFDLHIFCYNEDIPLYGCVLKMDGVIVGTGNYYDPYNALSNALLKTISSVHEPEHLKDNRER